MPNEPARAAAPEEGHALVGWVPAMAAFPAAFEPAVLALGGMETSSSDKDEEESWRFWAPAGLLVAPLFFLGRPTRGAAGRLVGKDEAAAAAAAW